MPFDLGEPVLFVEPMRADELVRRAEEYRCDAAAFGGSEQRGQQLAGGPGWRTPVAGRDKHLPQRASLLPISFNPIVPTTRMVIRVDQGKGHKDRYVMLSQQQLDLLRQWWRIARPRYWLFPGQVPGEPQLGGTGLSMQRRNGRGSISAWGFTPCAIASPRICSNGRPTSGPVRCFWATRSLTPGALYPCRHQGDRRGHQPARPAAHRGKTARLIAAYPCRVQRSRLRISSAATVRCGAAPTPDR